MIGLRALVAVVAVILAACGQAATRGVGAGPEVKLYEAVSTQGSQSISIVDSRTHAVERRLPFGTPSSDWTHLYWVKGTELVDTDPRSGRQLNSIQLPADYQLPPATMSGMPGGLSQDGRWLVLESWDQRTGSRPTATSLLVVDTSFVSTPVRIQLQGWFQFDAVSNDGARVYLIQYSTDTDYRVRVYQVKERLLDPSVVVDKTDPQDSMTGTRLMGVPSRDGQWLYSVYARADDGPFIHALNVEGSFAFCIDLPGSGYTSGATAFDWSLALSADGSRLYAANSALGVVSEVDTGEPALMRTAHIDALASSGRSWIQNVDAKELGTNASVLSPDGKTLVNAAASGIVLVDTSTLEVRARALNGRRVWSLGMSPDGSTVYALDDAGTIAAVSLSSGTVVSAFDPAAGYPMAIMRVTAA